jgi:hypothetical protein
MAGNIAHSDAYVHILAYVLKQAKGSTASSSKTLALLLLYTLLKTLEGPNRLALGIAVVEMFTETGLMLEGAEGKVEPIRLVYDILTNSLLGNGIGRLLSCGVETGTSVDLYADIHCHFAATPYYSKSGWFFGNNRLVLSIRMST